MLRVMRMLWMVIDAEHGVEVADDDDVDDGDDAEDVDQVDIGDDVKNGDHA